VNLAVHFIRAKSSLILSCSFGPFLFILYTLLVGVMGGKKRIAGEAEREVKEIDQPSITFILSHTLLSPHSR